MHMCTQLISNFLTKQKSCFLNIAGFVFACGHLLCAMIEMVSLWNISRVELNLCNALSPEQEQFSTRSYNWFIVSIDFKGHENLRYVCVPHVSILIFISWICRCFWLLLLITFCILSRLYILTSLNPSIGQVFNII